MTRSRSRGSRRPAVIGLAALALVGIALAASPPAPDFPRYAYGGPILDPAASAGTGLRYDPTGESIFPSVVAVAGRLTAPLGAFYLYYAPHDAPGGISLAYADRPDGPWTEYAGNPVIAADWPPHFQVSHVSSPDALIDQDGRVRLFFHGENDTTRVASSSDGLAFDYDGVAVSTADLPGATEVSYARVAEHAIPGLGNRYLMIVMVNGADDRRRLHLAWSSDGRAWTIRPTPLVSGTRAEGRDLSGGTWFPWDDRQFVVYGASSGDLYATEVGERFDQERHVGVFFHDATARAAAPAFLRADGIDYLFYERGPRRAARLAFATAVEAP